MSTETEGMNAKLEPRTFSVKTNKRETTREKSQTANIKACFEILQ